jgi:hypothetical protein
MLAEISSKVLRAKSIPFHSGLNVVLGDRNATNSIGKSTLLMLVDFAFGGESLLKHHVDLVAELGHHDYFFVFIFGDDELRFRRGTFEPDVVYICNESNEAVRGIDLNEFTAILKQSYELELPDLSFRSLVSLYIRVWGKENLSVLKPLHSFASQSQKECINTLIKVFDQYESIRELANQLDINASEKAALSSATKHGFAPALGKRQYTANQKRIDELEAEVAEIRDNLAKFATNISEIVNREVLRLKFDKDKLLESRMVIAGRLARVRQNLSENRHIQSKSFRELVEFFPQVNQDRIAKIEEFHSGVAKLLRIELKESERQLERQLSEIDSEIADIDMAISSTLSSIDKPSHIVDRVVNVAVELHDTKMANQKFETEATLAEAIRRLKGELSEEKGRVLTLVESLINDGMRRIVDSVFGAERKSPRIQLSEGSYSFAVHDDTGTGTAYASLVVLDLTVFLATRLPLVVHDSLLFKNIENDSVSRLLTVYQQTQKQSFIAIDEIEKYGANAASLLQERSVIQLGNENVLFTKDWRK